jgi:MATE family multidrug resistance protein
MGQSLMPLVDLFFCRDLGSAASATVGTSVTFFAWFMILGIGINSSLEYLIPHAIGSKEKTKADEYFFSGIVLVLILSAISMISLNLLAQAGPLYGMNPEIVAPVQGFSKILSYSFLATFMIPVLRVELQANGREHDTTYGFILGNVLNLFLNWALVLGHAGFPKLGVMGAAYANVFSRLGIMAFLFFRLKTARKNIPFPSWLDQVKWRLRMKTILRMGTPTSLHMLFEIGAFIFVSTLASRLPPEETAAHTIALTLASFAFMIPMGMSSAAALTMSRALGEGNPKMSTDLGDKTLRIGLYYALGSALFIFSCKETLMSWYTHDGNTLRIGTKLLLITAFFQFGDAMQVILSGCLRGLGETKVQAKMNAIGHWLVGAPIGLLLCFQLHLRIQGLWVGLSAGLFSVAGLLFLRYRSRTQEFRVQRITEV